MLSLKILQEKSLLFPNERILSPETTTFTIPAGWSLYRTGDAKEGAAPTKKVKVKAKAKATPQFFSSWQVAAMYSADGRALNQYTTVRPLNIFVISERTLNEFILVLEFRDPELSHADRKRIIEFVMVYGYGLHRVFACMTPLERNGHDSAESYFRKWAHDILKYDPHIVLSDTYMKPGTMTHIHRISVADTDYAAFNGMFKIEYPAIKEIIKSYNGFYTPKIRSGMFNEEFALTNDYEFPEELFLREDREEVVAFHSSHVYKNTVNEYVQGSFCSALTDVALFSEFSLEGVTRIYLFTRVYKFIYAKLKACIQQINDVKDGLYPYKHHASDFISRFHKYIVFRLLPEVEKVIDAALVIPENLLQPASVPIQANNPFYLPDGTINGNLFTYTVLSSVIQQTIAGLRAFHEICLDSKDSPDEEDLEIVDANFVYSVPHIKSGYGYTYAAENKPLTARNARAIARSALAGTALAGTALAEAGAGSKGTKYYEFVPTMTNVNVAAAPTPHMIPIVSGGALFGVYTWGSNRRQTKDVDVKMVLSVDSPENGRESEILASENHAKFTQQESYLWEATMINFLWMEINDTIFNEIAELRIASYSNKINSFGKMQIKPTDMVGWLTYIASDRNTRLVSKTLDEFDRFLYDRSGRRDGYEHIVSSYFQEWLSHKPYFEPFLKVEIKSLNDYNIAFKRLLEHKKAIRAKSVKKADSAKHLEDLTTIKHSLNNLSKLVKSNTDFTALLVARGIPTAYIEMFYKFNTNLQNLLDTRPQLLLQSENLYGVGWFLSLYIYNKKTPAETFGLLDLTYDSH